MTDIYQVSNYTPCQIGLVKGERGENGANGANGVNGKDGKDGKDGLRGLSGSDGKSNYQLALDAGFIGSLADYQAELRGVKGEDGTDATIDFLPVVTGAAGTPVVSVVSGTPSARTIALTIPKGDDGVDGKSAYQSALDNGFIGTEAEWKLYLKSDGSIQALQQFMTNPASTEVSVPDYGNIPSLQGYISTMFEAGGLPAKPFATKALMTASALVDGDYAQVTDDTVNNGLYVKTAGVWVKSPYDPVSQAKTYADENPLFKPQMVAAINLDELKTAGIYHVYTDVRAVELGLPNGKAGQLYVSGETQPRSYVFQTYINSAGETHQRVFTSAWSAWEGQTVRALLSTENLNTVMKSGIYSTNSTGSTIANNFPFASTSRGMLLINSNASTVRQQYFSEDGIAYRVGLIGSGSVWIWGAWRGFKYASSGVTDLSNVALKSDIPNPANLVEVGKPTFVSTVSMADLGGHLDNTIESGTWHTLLRSMATSENGFPITGQTGFLTVRYATGSVTTQMWQTQDGYAMRWGSYGGSAGSKPDWMPWHGFKYTDAGIADLSLMNTKIAVLEANQGSGGGTVITAKPLYGWGSSTLELAGSYFTTMAARHNHVYVGHGVSGETLAVSGLQQGANVVTLKFSDATITNGINYPVVISQSFTPKRGRSYKEVELSNGVKGLLYFSDNTTNINTFKPTNLTEPLAVDTTYEYRAINPQFINQGKGLYYFDIGKNNMGYADTAQDIVDAQQTMIDYIPEGSEYLVGGHFVNTDLGGTDYGNKVLAVNAMLKLRYGLRFCDYYDFLYDDAVWAKYGLVKTPDDLLKIAKMEMPVTLGRILSPGVHDTAHLRDEMSAEIALQAEARFTKLGYFS